MSEELTVDGRSGTGVFNVEIGPEKTTVPFIVAVIVAGVLPYA
jgi:hypothetical protein